MEPYRLRVRWADGKSYLRIIPVGHCPRGHIIPLAARDCVCCRTPPIEMTIVVR